MVHETKRPESLPAFLGRGFGIVIAAFILGLAVGLLMAGGEAADTNDNDPSASSLPVVPVTVSSQPLPPSPPSNLNPAPGIAPTPSSLVVATYTVQPGDSLSIIADRVGVSVQALIAANQITQPNALAVGQVLVIPRP